MNLTDMNVWNISYSLLMFFYLFILHGSDYHDHKFEAPGGSSSILHDCKVDPPYIGYVSVSLFTPFVLKLLNYPSYKFLFIYLLF